MKKRKCFKIEIYNEFKKEYKMRNNNLWPEMRD
ncbi:L-rhamnose mutarotase [Clostridium beijerinckii]|nr:L-rhamnose mutarotase [Clostridium beijerinckii]NRY60236.1 L-rhamnose mutarotase [Clostridium beijerinckii]